MCIPYFVGGALFRKYRLQATGKDIIPNVDFWAAMPGLIREGAEFSWLHAKVIWGRVRSRGGGYERF
jgi:hypothetical protein